MHDATIWQALLCGLRAEIDAIDAFYGLTQM